MVDPALVRALESIRRDRPFWDSLGQRGSSALASLEPGERIQMADGRTLDRVAEAFAKVVEAKSPFTYRHSEGVAEIAVGTSRALRLSAEELGDLRRAALPHDIGKLGVSNLIRD